MPSREDVFYNGGIYHIYDKTIDDIDIFSSRKIAYEFINVVNYYRSSKVNYRYSMFKKLDNKSKETKLKKIKLQKYFKVDILSYCLMPNHYHFLIKQLKENGIKTFMANILNSITRFFNILNNRKGPVFLTQFKSNEIRHEEQLIYVSRYIHTNPYAGSIVDEIGEIFNYPFSSITAYMENHSNDNKINTDLVLNYFKGNKQRYKNFISKNADDQKAREWLKYSEKWL